MVWTDVLRGTSDQSSSLYQENIHKHRENSLCICSVTGWSDKVAVVLSCVYENGVTKTVNVHDSHQKPSEQRLLLVCNASVRLGGRKLSGPGWGPSLSSCWPEAMCRTIMQQERGAIVIRASPKLGQELIWNDRENVRPINLQYHILTNKQTVLIIHQSLSNTILFSYPYRLWKQK